MMRRKMMIILIISFCIELVLFQFRFFQFNLTNDMQSTELSLEVASLGEGIEDLGNNTYRVLNSANQTITFLDINQTVNSIYLDIDSGDEESVVLVDVSFTDEGNSNPYLYSNRAIVSSLAHSKWLQTELYGQCHSLTLRLNQEEESVVRINRIAINTAYPFQLNILRIMIMIGVGCFIVIFHPRSAFYQWKITPFRKEYMFVLASVSLLLILFWGKFINYSHDYYVTHSDIGNQNQYQRLAISLSKGHLYLEEAVPQFLIDMENPYNTVKRAQLIEETGENIQWDNAYYKGHYYVYFGVLPVLLFYLPYYLIRGTVLPNKYAVFLVCVLLIFAVFKLLYTICKRWFQKTPFITYLLTGVTFICGCGTFIVIRRATLYELPIILGVLLAILGLDQWLCAIEERGTINKLPLFLGSLLIALITCSRPTIFFIFPICLVIFSDYIVEDKKICIQKYWSSFVCFVIPFIMVAVGVMYYNYARFDSPFDFGALYNLTMNDMTRRGFHITRTFNTFYEFYLKPIHIIPQFPFVEMQGQNSAYIDITSEKTFGSYFSVNCVLTLSLLVFRFRNSLKKYHLLLPLSYVFLLVNLVITFVDSNVAGIIMRYQMDSIYLFYIVTAFMIFFFEANWKDQDSVLALTREVVTILCALTILVNFFSIWGRLLPYNLEIFYKMKYLFEVWI